MGKSNHCVRGCKKMLIVVLPSKAPRPGPSHPDTGGGEEEEPAVAAGFIWRQGRPRASWGMSCLRGPLQEHGCPQSLACLAAGTQMSKTPRSINVQHFQMQGMMSDAHAAASGLFSPAHSVGGVGVGWRQSCHPVWPVKLFLVMQSMAFLLQGHRDEESL